MKAGKYGSWLSADDGKSAEKFKTFGGSFVFGFTSHDSSATSTVGGTGIVSAGRGVTVMADMVDRPEAITTADVTSGQATAARNYQETQKEYAGAFSILLASYTSTSTAQILSGATIETNTLIGVPVSSLTVQARTFIPYDFPLERVLGLTDFFVKLGEVLTSRNFGATTSWAKASARIHEGFSHRLVQQVQPQSNGHRQHRLRRRHQSGAGAARPGDVVVRADTESQIVNFVDNPIKLIGTFEPFKSGSPPAGSSGAAPSVWSTTRGSRQPRSLMGPASRHGI